MCVYYSVMRIRALDLKRRLCRRCGVPVVVTVDGLQVMEDSRVWCGPCSAEIRKDLEGPLQVPGSRSPALANSSMNDHKVEDV
jgi:ribosomal protein S27AE